MTSLFFSFLTVIVYPMKTMFSKKCPTIVIKESISDKTLTPEQKPLLMSQLAGLAEEETQKLNEGKCTLKTFDPEISELPLSSLNCKNLYF